MRLWSLAAFILVACGDQKLHADLGDAGPDEDSSVADADVDAAVDAPPGSTAVELLDLGHVEGIRSLQISGNRGLSLDFKGRWVLWDLASNIRLARGDTDCIAPGFCAAMAGDYLLTRPQHGLEVRSSASGALLTTIPVSFVWNAGIARDGSYVWAGSFTDLRAWSPSGALLVNIAGNYGGARIHAAPDALRIGNGPAGTDKIETVVIATQARSTVTFAGAFHSWFLDGERFLSVVNTTVRTYSKTGVAIALGALPTIQNLTGQGNWVWTQDAGTARFYAVDDLATAAYTDTFGTLVPSGNTIANIVGTEPEVLTLGSSVVRGTPFAIPPMQYPIAGSDGTRWLVGDSTGRVFEADSAVTATPSWAPLALGAVIDTAGSGNTTAALATASGTLIVDVTASQPLQRVIDAASYHIELSTDGSVLVVGPPLDGGLRVFDVESGMQTHAWSATDSLLSYSFAPTGKLLCHVHTSDRLYTDVTGSALPSFGPPLSGDFDERTPRFSPDGTKAIFQSGQPYGWSALTASMQIFTNGELSGAANGVFTTWVGNDRILLTHWATMPKYPGRSALKLYDTTGTLVANGVLVPDPLTWVGGTQVYSIGNAIYDFMTGQKIWQGDPDTRLQHPVIVGDHVLYTIGPRVLVDKFR